MLTTFSLPVFWGLITIVFVIVEITTYTLYGISIAIAAALVCTYVYITGATEVDLVQGFLFVIISAILSYLLPRWFSYGKQSAIAMGLDGYIGKVFPLERVSSDWKVKIYGVDYLVDSSSVDDSFTVGMKVRIEAVRGGVLTVSRVR